MIINPARLLQGTTVGSIEAYKLGLLKFYVLDILALRHDITITSAARSLYQQRNLKGADGKPIPASKKAKRLSQHVLGEAVDFTCDDMVAAYNYLLDELGTWQAFLYIDDGMPKSIHVSMPSQVPTIVAKSLLNVDGLWLPYEGVIPVTRA